MLHLFHMGLSVSRWMSFSAKIVHRLDAVRPDGTAAVNLQVIIHRRRKVFPLKIWVKKGELNANTPAITLGRVGKEWRELEQNYNSILLNALSRALNIIAEAQAMHRPLDLETFTAQFTSVKLERDFIGFVEQCIEQERGLVAKGTTLDNEKVLARLRRWRTALSFAELHVATIRDFEREMKKWGLAASTIASTHKGVRKFILRAKKDFPSIQNPYTDHKIRWPEGGRDFLTPHEVRLLLDAYRTPGELVGSMRRAARCFLFQCFTGLRVGDASALTYDNLIGEHIAFTAEKTKRVKLARKLKLNEIALGLIEDAFTESGRRRREGALVDFYKDDQPYNVALRSMAAWLGIEKHLTSHVGRHTFATNYLIAGGKVERLMRILGHSELDTTMVYVHLVEDFLDLDMEGLSNYFKVG
jgi:integrase/recombinase XerD